MVKAAPVAAPARWAACVVLCVDDEQPILDSMDALVTRWAGGRHGPLLEEAKALPGSWGAALIDYHLGSQLTGLDLIARLGAPPRPRRPGHRRNQRTAAGERSGPPAWRSCTSRCSRRCHERSCRGRWRQRVAGRWSVDDFTVGVWIRARTATQPMKRRTNTTAEGLDALNAGAHGAGRFKRIRDRAKLVGPLQVSILS